MGNRETKKRPLGRLICSSVIPLGLPSVIASFHSVQEKQVAALRAPFFIFFSQVQA
jgi:hypothetical protein